MVRSKAREKKSGYKKSLFYNKKQIIHFINLGIISKFAKY